MTNSRGIRPPGQLVTGTQPAALKGAASSGGPASRRRRAAGATSGTIPLAQSGPVAAPRAVHARLWTAAPGHVC